MVYKHHHYKPPTDDDIKRHLRPIRAEYMRNVRKLSKHPEDNNGCSKRLGRMATYISEFIRKLGDK